jgi:hypothetical protein
MKPELSNGELVSVTLGPLPPARDLSRHAVYIIGKHGELRWPTSRRPKPIASFSVTQLPPHVLRYTLAKFHL